MKELSKIFEEIRQLNFSIYEFRFKIHLFSTWEKLIIISNAKIGVWGKNEIIFWLVNASYIRAPLYQ